jgi:hypothetical protein
MNIIEFADLIGVNINITYYPNQQTRFSASIDHGETKDNKNDGILRGTIGNDGNSPVEALNALAHSISNKWLIIRAYGDDRQEYHVPVLSEYAR